MASADNAYFFDTTGFGHLEFHYHAALHAVLGCCCGIVDVVAKPLVHGCFTTGEFGLLLHHRDVVDFFFFNRLGFCDNLLFYGHLVKVVGTFGNVDGTGLSFILHHFLLVLHLFVLLEIIVLDDEKVGDALLVGNFFGGYDFFWFLGNLEHLFFFDFLLFRFVSHDFLFGGRNELFLLRFREYAFHHEDEKGEDDSEAYEYYEGRFVVAGVGRAAQGIRTEVLIFAFEDNVAPFLR